MDTNNKGNTVQKESLFTPKKIFRILSLICIVLIFCPMFLVSCGGETLEVDVMTAVGGLSMYEETVVEPQPIMLLCLLIPAAVLVMSLTKKIEPQKGVMWTLISMVVDFIIWVIFRSTVKKYADEYLCTFEATGWFYVNMISMSLIILFAALILLKVITLDTDLIKLFTFNNNQELINLASNKIKIMAGTINEMVVNVMDNSENKEKSTNINGFCVHCGVPILKGAKFCTSCGTEISSDILKAAEQKQAEELININSENVH